MATQGFLYSIKQMNHEYYADMVIDNDFGIYRTTLKDRIGIDVVPPISLFQPLVGAGSCAWSIVFFLFVGIRKHGNKMVLPYIPSLALWLTLLVATPLAFGMRYALPLAFTLPFLMVLPYIPVNLKQAEQTNNYSIKVIIHNVVLSMIGPVCFVLSIFFLIETRDEFHLVSYSDQQQVIGLTQDTYLEQHMNFTQDFDLNRISLWTQTDTSEQSEAYSIYLALLNEAGTVIWQADVSSTQLNADPLNPWTLFYCNDVHIEPGNYVLQIHGNGENELSGLVVGPVYQDEKVVEPLIINGYPSDLYINLKVIG